MQQPHKRKIAFLEHQNLISETTFLQDFGDFTHVETPNLSYLCYTAEELHDYIDTLIFADDNLCVFPPFLCAKFANLAHKDKGLFQYLAMQNGSPSARPT